MNRKENIDKFVKELWQLLFPPGPRVCNATDARYWAVGVDVSNANPKQSVTITTRAWTTDAADGEPG